MSGSRQRRKEATFRAGREEGLATAEAERNLFKGKYRSIVTLLNTTRCQLQEIFDHVDDEGDRRYFGSTNHVDWLKGLLDDMDGWSIDAMLPKGDINKMEADPYAEIRAQQARAEAAEAEVKRLQAEINRKSSMPGDHRYWEGRYRDEAAENEKLRSVLQPMAKVAGDVSETWPDDAQVVTEIGHFRRARTALASTGGEHHAE